MGFLGTVQPGLVVCLTLAPFMTAEDSDGKNCREAGWPCSGWVAWMITRCSWMPTMPQPRATVTAVCRLSPRSVRQGQSLTLSRGLVTLMLIGGPPTSLSTMAELGNLAVSQDLFLQCKSEEQLGWAPALYFARCCITRA